MTGANPIDPGDFAKATTVPIPLASFAIRE
jgi:hypothetical protein